MPKFRKEVFKYFRYGSRGKQNLSAGSSTNVHILKPNHCT